MEYAAQPTPENEAAVRGALGREAVEWQYLHGVPEASLVAPDAWEHDLALLARPGVDRAQLALFADYPSKPTLYPELQARLRKRGVPVLAIWGRNDLIFGPDGARAFRRDTERHSERALDPTREGLVGTVFVA